jgi:hypothetical protein
MTTLETERFIQRLADSSEPVRRLPRPWLRTAAWLALAIPYVALVVYVVSPRDDLIAKLWDLRYFIEQAAALATGIAAAVAAFASTIPGYDRKFLFLPMLPLAVWLGSLGQGCIQAGMRFGPEGLLLQPDWFCFPAIVLVGAIPAVAMAVMLRRGAPLAPHITTALGGLAAAGLGNFGLRLFHAQDASLMVLVWQVGTVFVLTAMAAWAGRRLLNWQAAARAAKLLSRAIALSLLLVGAIHVRVDDAAADPRRWRSEWPRTDFSKHSISLAEIRSGGPRKDGIPSIDAPRFERLELGLARGWTSRLNDKEPVIALSIGGDARAYPLRVLMWHEIVNDTVGDKPVAITYCPLCNAALVFERRLDGRILDFGTTGNLRNSDLVMYDRQTESWWQQFTGEAIIGAMTGRQLLLIPSRLESFGRFRQRFPEGQVLVPNNPSARNYGANPYVGYNAAGQRPFLYDGTLPEGIEPMERVVAVETTPGHHEAWSLSLLRRQGTIQSGDLVLTWDTGQASALDKASIAEGRDVGNVVVQRRGRQGMFDVPYDVTFAFVFHAFRKGSPIHKADPAARTN